MSLFNKMKKFLGLKDNNTDVIKVKVICDKCGEEIESYFRRNYDIQTTYGSEEHQYLINKQLVCGSCYQSIKLKVELDSNLNQLNSTVVGGEMICRD